MDRLQVPTALNLKCFSLFWNSPIEWLGLSQESGSSQKSKNSFYMQYIRLPRYDSTDLFRLNLKKSVESTTGAYCTESKAFFTFLKLTHRVTWLPQKSGSLQKSKNSLYIQYIRPPRYDSTDLFRLKNTVQNASTVCTYSIDIV